MFGRSTLLSVAIWGIVAGALRVSVAAPEACGDRPSHDLRAAAGAAIGWVQRAQLDDGRYVYLYDAESDDLARDYNDVRHAGVTMALYQSAGRGGDEQTLAAADAGLEWMRRRLVRHERWAALLAPGASRAKLGASALMLVGLAERRLATGDESYDPLMRELGSFLASMQRSDGGFYVAWRVLAAAPDREGTSRYYPGEALWALALLHEALPGEGWDRYARAAADFVTSSRDELEGVRFPPLADQWAAYGLAEMAEWGLSDDQAAYARRLAGRFGVLVRAEAKKQHGGPATLVFGRDARAAGVGTWVEGLAALWRLSVADERLADLRPRLEQRLACAAGILASRQMDERAAGAYPRPQLVEGAWFSDGATRMDDQQHAFSGLLYAADAADGRARREPAEPAR